MFVVSDLIEYTAVDSGGDDLLKLPGIKPRDPQTGIASGDITVTPSGLSNGDEIYAFFERLRDSDSVTFDGADYPTVYDPYMGRHKCLFKLTYTGGDLDFNLNLTTPADPQLPQSAGSLQLFKVSDVFEVDSDVFATYPLRFNTGPRAATERKEDDSDINKVFGREPRLTISLNLQVRGDYADDTDVDSDIQKFLNITSPQKNFIFQARQIWQTWIIGVSEDRVIRHSFDDYNRQTVNNLPLEVL